MGNLYGASESGTGAERGISWPPGTTRPRSISPSTTAGARKSRSMEILDLVLAIIGGIRGGAAVVASVGALLRNRRRRALKRELELQVYRLRRLSRRITGLSRRS